jgi:hypothetical protein
MSGSGCAGGAGGISAAGDPGGVDAALLGHVRSSDGAGGSRRAGAWARPRSVRADARVPLPVRAVCSLVRDRAGAGSAFGGAGAASPTTASVSVTTAGASEGGAVGASACGPSAAATAAAWGSAGACRPARYPPPAAAATHATSHSTKTLATNCTKQAKCVRVTAKQPIQESVQSVKSAQSVYNVISEYSPHGTRKTQHALLPKALPLSNAP